MQTVDLDNQRCTNCHRLLFRGVLGMGIVEVKCPRCGHISRLHAVDTLLRGKEARTYILAYNPEGFIIVASRSAERILGYTQADFRSLTIQAISPRNQLPILKESASTKALHEWEQYHVGLTSEMVHKTKSGVMLEVKARFYPIASYAGFYTVAVYDTK